MAFDMFLKIGDIKGEAQDDERKGTDGWMDILAWSWGASNSGTTHVGGGSGAGKANFQDISVTKYIDAASPYLLMSTATGKHHAEAELIVRKAGEKPMTYLVITMSDVLISSYQTGGSGGEDRLTENVVINFGAFEFTYTVQEKDGSEGAKPDFKYDIAGNVAL